MVSAKGFVASKIGTVAIIGGLIIGASLLAKKFNVGEQVVGSLRAFGQTTGQSIGAPFTGLVEGFGDAGKELGNASVALSEGFQRSVCQTLGICGPCGLFICPDTKDAQITGPGGGSASKTNKRENTVAPTRILDLKNVLSRRATVIRQNNVKKNTLNIKNTPFGGFGSAQAQESALQKALRESREKFPQFFKV